jgi:glucose/arabinose dehydrogenase
MRERAKNNWRVPKRRARSCFVRRKISLSRSLTFTFFTLALLASERPAVAADDKLRTGRAAFGDWTEDAPGVRRKITVADLPPPNQTSSADNGPDVVSRPKGAEPQVLPGFVVEQYAGGFTDPRFLLTAPNGDVFVVESSANEINVLRDGDGDGKPEMTQLFTREHLNQAFGIAFYPPGRDPHYLYVANTNGVIRFPYRNGDMKARGRAELLGAQLSPGGLLRGGGHWTRGLAFSADGKKMYVSVGSLSNNSDRPSEADRARIFEFNPDGSGRRVFAWGIRNAVGIVVRPGTNELWMSTNERDGLGDDLVPDYISSVRRGGFYGWPWFYLGDHPDPRHKGKHPELGKKAIVPDVLVQAHSASLNLCFYDGTQFPAEYRGDIFACFHGSWNRTRRTGYKVVRVPFENGKVLGEYEDFVTGFVTPNGNVWGRPVGVTVAKDGALLFSEDGNGTIWRVSYPAASTGKQTPKDRAP